MKGFIVTLCLALLLPFGAIAGPTTGSLQINLSIEDESVSISWNAMAQADEFVVEVATETDEDGDLIFQEIGHIEASFAKNYTFVDETKKGHGLRYYRVKQVSMVGEMVVSDIRTVNFQFKDNFASTISASKDLGTVDITISAKHEGAANISLSSVMDDFETSQLVKLDEGLNSFSIPVDPTIPMGNYLLSINVNNDAQIVLLKKEEMNEFIVSDE